MGKRSGRWKRAAFAAVVLASSWGGVVAVRAGTIVMDNITYDAEWNPVNGAVIANTAGAKYVGYWPGTYTDWNWFLPVDLGELAPGAMISTATLNVWLDAMNLNIGDPRQFHVDLYGIGYSSSILTLPDIDDDLFYVGDNDPDHAKLKENAIAQGADRQKWYPITSSDLVAYLNNRPEGSNVVWLRLNHHTFCTTGERWSMGYIADESPTLEYELAVPRGGTVIMVQ